MSDTDEFLQTACEQFLGMEVDDIRSLLLDTFEGHLRAIGKFLKFFYNFLQLRKFKNRDFSSNFEKSVQWT